MSGQSGVSPETLPLPKGGGAIRSIGDTFSPDLHTGTGSYRIPLRFLPGPGGFQPEMGLVYTSGGGSGPFGIGWLLPVLEIARKSDRGFPTFVDDVDDFVLDRQDLVRLGEGRFRHKKEEVFRRVERTGEGGWEVRDRSGRTFFLGTTAASRIEEERDGLTFTYAWRIDRAVDRNGNEIHYQYFRDGNQLYLESISYGIYSTTFHYEPRPDALTDRRPGFDITTGLRCNSIEFHILGDPDPLFRRYSFTYDECPFTGISKLSSATLSGHRSGPGGAEEASLPTLHFKYTAFEPGHRYVSFGSSTGDPPPDSLQNPEFDLVDLFGTGLPGVIQLGGPIRRYWPNQGDGTWGPPRTLREVPPSATLATAPVAFADMNGDGLTDLMTLAERPLGYFRNEPGKGFGAKARFRSAPVFDPRDTQLRLVDLNGDGVVDAVRTGQRSFYFFYNRGDQGWETPVAIPRIHDLERFPDIFFSDPRVKLADMSGDGITDVIWVHGSSVDWWPHYGNGRFGGRITLSIQPAIGPRFDPERLFLSDINGDGVADLVYVETDRVRLWVNRGGNQLVDAGTIPYTPTATADNVRLADMSGTGTVGLVWSYPPRRVNSRNYKFLDFTGGRRPYLLEEINDGTGLVTKIEYRPSTTHAMEAARERRPWESALPFPVQVISRITEQDTVTGSSTVRSMRYFDGLFDGASREFRGFGRAEVLEEGDANTPSTLTISHFHQGTGGSDDWALSGKLLRMEVFGPDESPLASLPFRVEENQYETRIIETGPSGDRAVFPFLAQTTVSTFERGGSPQVFRSKLEFDHVGNPTRKEDEWLGGSGPERLVTNMSYTGDEDQWILNLPVELNRIDGSGTLLSLSRYYYDGAPFVGLPLGQVQNGNLSRREEMVLTDGMVSAAYGLTPPDFVALGYHRMSGPGGTGGWGANVERTESDGHGNTVARMDALGNSGTISIGPDNTFPDGVTDAVGHAYSIDYDIRSGEISRVHDPNGHETRYGFDPLGRLVSFVKPGDSDQMPTVRFEHLQDTLPLAVRTRLRQRPGDADTTDTVEYYDGFKQILQQRTSAEGGQVVVDGFRRRDARGWEAVRSAMFFSTGFEFVPDEGSTGPGSYQFRRDALGRIVETVTPDGRPSRLVYEAGQVTAFDVSDTDDSPENVANGIFNTPKRLRYDGQGRLVEVIEDTGALTLTTRYTRDAMGRLTAIEDARGVQTARYRYDLLGRKIEVNHVDAGRRRVVFNARGEIARSFDASDRAVDMVYDPIRRLTETQVEGAVVERYFYDLGVGANLAGRLARVEDEAGATTLSYTARGLIESKTREIDTLTGTSAFTVDYQYDSLDRMTGLTHPGGTPVEYTYNKRSLVDRIEGFINGIEYNEFGQRTRMVFANGVEQRDTFDPATYYLDRSRITGPARPDPYYEMSYSHDAAGNPLSITDHVTAIGHAHYQRQFRFDALSRLRQSEGTLNGAPFQHLFDYDAADNFTRNEEFSNDDLVLEPGGSNRIRGTVSGGIETDLFSYDAGGNTLSTPDATLEYDARGRLRRVTRANGTVAEFTYDHQGERVRKRVTSGGVTRETLYVDGILEVVNGATTRFVFHNDARIGAVRESSTLFYHHDHLGNVVLSTSSAGDLIEEIAYRAFGAVAHHSGPNPPEFGFLGNEADADTGLVFFQSRYYDPGLGRFITPDPFLLLNPETVLETPCGLNLYAYAGNNPAKLVDREGAFWKWIVGAVIIAALVVATVVVGVATGGAGFAFGILLMASIGSALGSGIGTYSAWRAGGNLEDGFLLGAIVGGAAGAASYAVGAAVGAAGISGAWGSVLAGAAQGAVLGAANGAIIGYAGGAGGWKDILLQAGIGALIGAVLGGLAGYVSSLGSKGGALKAGTFEKALGEGTAKGTGAYGQPIQQSYSTGLASAGRALDTATRSTLNSIIHHTAQPIVYVSIGSAAHAAVYHDWDAIKSWILETFGGEEEEVTVGGPSIEWG